jgi:hypothetical protein
VLGFAEGSSIVLSIATPLSVHILVDINHVSMFV